MKRLMVMAVLGASACAVSAEEKSFWSGLFSSEKDAAAETATAQDSQIAKLNKQLEELMAKIEKAKSSSRGDIDALKKKYEEVTAQLKAKLAEYRDTMKADDEESAARKAELAQTKTNAVNLVNSIRSLFK